MTKLLSMLAAATVLAGVAAPAAAAPTITFTAGSSVGAGYTVVQNFNGVAGSYGLTGVLGTDYKILSGNVSGQGAMPNTSGSPYLAVMGNKSVTYTFATAASTIAFDWGTASSDNTLYLTDVNNNTTCFQVSDTWNWVLISGANYNANGLLISVANGPAIKSLTFSAGSNSFEIDNIAVLTPNAGAVPEPATWAMMIIGFGAIGSTMRRRRTAVNFAAA